MQDSLSHCKVNQTLDTPTLWRKPAQGPASMAKTNPQHPRHSYDNNNAIDRSQHHPCAAEPEPSHNCHLADAPPTDMSSMCSGSSSLITITSTTADDSSAVGKRIVDRSFGPRLAPVRRQSTGGRAEESKAIVEGTGGTQWPVGREPTPFLLLLVLQDFERPVSFFLKKK